MSAETAYYEISYIASATLTEDQAQGAEESLRTLLGSYHADIESWDSPKKRMLSYPIKKETEVYLGALRFVAPVSGISELGHKLKNEHHILRSTLMHWKKEQPRHYPLPRVVVRKEEPIPTDEKALEEKLQEILGAQPQ